MKTKRILPVLALVLTLILALALAAVLSIALGDRLPVSVTVADDSGWRYAVCISDDPRSRSAARYLSDAAARVLGAAPEIIVGDAPTEQPRFTILAAQAPEAVTADYELCFDREKNINLLIYRPEMEYETVRAVTDRWLMPDCGRKTEGKLRLSQHMIDDQLSGLSLEIPDLITVLSQNLLIGSKPDGNSVEERAERFIRLVKDTSPDVIGVQEYGQLWVDLIEAGLGDEYTICGVARDDPLSRLGERVSVLFRKDRFQLLASDTFWLSDTPWVPVSKLDYDGTNRTCSWVLLKDRLTGKPFTAACTHLQNGNAGNYAPVRLRQAEILWATLREAGNGISAFPLILVGDFNAAESESSILYLRSVSDDASRICLRNSSRVDYTFHDFGRKAQLLDYAFVTPDSAVVPDFRIVDDMYGGYVSDHYALLFTVHLR